MKKRIMALLLSVFVILSMLPVTAFGVDELPNAEGTWDVNLNVYEYTGTDYAKYNDENVLMLGFGVRSKDLGLKNAQTIKFAVDLELYDLLEWNEETDGFVAVETAPTAKLVAYDNAAAIGETVKTKAWSPKIYYAAKDKIGWVEYMVTSGSKMNAPTTEADLSNLFLGLKAGKKLSDVTEDSIRFMTAEELTATEQTWGVAITDGGSNIQHAFNCDGKTADELKIEPEIVWHFKTAAPAYSGTEASTPTALSNAGGTIVLNEQAITDETVQYACSTTNSTEGLSWQDSTTFSDLTCGTTYYFFARVKASETHKAGTASSALELVPLKGDPTVTWPTAAIYVNDTLADTDLTGGEGAGTFSVTGTKTWTSAGDKTTTVVFTPTNTTNYNTLTKTDVAVTVSKRNVASAAAQTAITNKNYGTVQASLGLPTTVTITAEGNKTFTVPVTWSGYDSTKLTAQSLTGTLDLSAIADEVQQPATAITASISVTLQPNTPGTVSYEDKTAAYSGNPIPHTLASTPTGVASVAYSYAGTGTTSYTAGSTAPTNAGTYTVTATFTMQAGYAQIDPKMVNLTIEKASQTATAPVITAHTDTTVTATKVTGQKYQILPSTETAPTAADSGWGDTASFTGLNRNTAYTVYSYIPGDDNHDASPVVSTEQTTDKTTIGGTVTVDNTSPKYGDTLNAVTTAVTPSGATLSYQWYRGNTAISSATGSSYTVTADDIGSTLKVIVTATGDYTGSVSSENTSAAQKADGSVTAPTAKTLTYNGGEQELVNAGSSTTGTIQYKLGAGSYGTTIPKATDAGTYTVYYKVVGDATHSDVAEQSVEVTISPLDVTGATVGAFGAMTYTGSPQTPSATVTKNTLPATGTWSSVTNVADKTTFTANGNFTGTITDQSTGMNKKTVDALDLTSLVTKPVKNGTPQSSFADQTQYTGTISWNGSPAKFLGGTAYTATLSLTATDNYTFTGVAANSFTYTDATVTNAANSGAVTVAFPATANAAVNSIAIKTPASKLAYKCGETLDVTNLVITATMDDATTQDVNVTAAMVSGFDSSAVAASKTLTITYGGKTTTYNVSIAKADGPAAPSCTFSFDGANAGKLMGAATAMEYSLDGGAHYTACTPNMALTTANITTANGIKVRVAETATTKAGAVQTITITKAETPVGVGKTDCTTSANNDGTITGVTTAMEYRKSGESTWTACGGTTVTGLANGTYQVRVKAHGTAMASDAVSVTIAAKYTVTWKSQDGNSTLETDSNVAAGSAPSFDQDNPTKGEDANYTYTFAGWATSANAESGTAEGNLPAVTGNVTYYAAFSKTSKSGGGDIPTPPPASGEVKLTYMSGSTVYAEETYDKGTEVVLDKIPTRVCFTFTGWYEDVACTKKLDKITMNGDKTVYAGWKQTPIPALLSDEHYAYVVGYEDGTVRPEANITRAEVATIFFRLLLDEVREQNLTRTNSYIDVSSSSWYNTAVSTLSAMGIIHGYEDGTFHGERNITRAEFAAIAARFDSVTHSSGSNFTDVLAHWAKNEIGVASNNGWITGYEDGTFRPDQQITRAEAFALINRVVQRNPETENDLLKDMVTWSDNADTGKWYYLDVQEATNSHDHARKDSGYEYWTALTENRDWSLYN